MKRRRAKKRKRGWNGGMRPSAEAVKQATDLGYITTAEAAALMGVVPSTVVNWIKAGKLPTVHDERAPTLKIGPFRWVYRDSVLAMKPDMAAIASAS